MNLLILLAVNFYLVVMKIISNRSKSMKIHQTSRIFQIFALFMGVGVYILLIPSSINHHVCNLNKISRYVLFPTYTLHIHCKIN